MIEGRATLRAESSVRARGQVEHGVNGARIAFLAFLLAVGVGVGSLLDSWLAGVLAMGVVVLVFALPPTRHALMAGVHRLTRL